MGSSLTMVVPLPAATAVTSVVRGGRRANEQPLKGVCLAMLLAALQDPPPPPPRPLHSYFQGVRVTPAVVQGKNDEETMQKTSLFAHHQLPTLSWHMNLD